MAYTPPTGAGNVTYGTGTSGSTLTVNKPANLADGDLLVLVAFKQLGGTTFTTPAGFTSVYAAVASSTRGFHVFGRKITTASGEPSTYSVTSSDSSSRWILTAFRLPGMKTSWLDAMPGSDIYGTNAGIVTDPAITAVGTNTLALAFNFTNNSSAIYQAFSAAGWAALANGAVTAGSSTSVVDVQYRELTSAGSTGAQAFTMTPNAASFGGFLVTLAIDSLPGGAVGLSGSGALSFSGVSPTVGGTLPLSGSGSLGFAGIGPDGPRGRIYRLGITGAEEVEPRGRIYRLGISPSLMLLPFTSQVVEPGVEVTMTAVLSDGGPADSYSWSQISGPPVILSGVGATRTFISPRAHIPGAQVVFSVTATRAGTTTAEQEVLVTALPHVMWTRAEATDWEWVPLLVSFGA